MLVWCIAIILPIIIDNTDNAIIKAENVLKTEGRTCMKSLISTANAADFEPTARNAVIGVGAPS